MAPATHQVVALAQLLHDHRNIRRIVLEVAIKGDDLVAAAGIKTSGHGGGLAVVTAQQHGHQFGGGAAQLLQQFSGAVARAVIHQHQLKGFPQGPQAAEQLSHEHREALLFVVEGDHHRKGHGRLDSGKVAAIVAALHSASTPQFHAVVGGHWAVVPAVQRVDGDAVVAMLLAGAV